MPIFHQVIPAKSATDKCASPILNCTYSFADVVKLERQVKECLGHGIHCQGCMRVKQFLSTFRTRPGFVHVGWNLTSTVNPRMLEHLLQVLKAFADEIELESVDKRDDVHQRFAALVTSFIQQRQSQNA